MIATGAGHGGIINKIYQTKGKRGYQPELTKLIDEVLCYDSKGWFYEGVYNREFVFLINAKLKSKGIECENITKTEKDVYLSKRVKDVNEISKLNKNTSFISVHCNGHTKTSANGFEIFTYLKASKNSLRLAKCIHKSVTDQHPDLKDRGVKKKNLKMVRETRCPAVLIELGFMTNTKDCKYLLENINELADSVVDGIINYQ